MVLGKKKREKMLNYKSFENVRSNDKYKGAKNGLRFINKLFKQYNLNYKVVANYNSSFFVQYYIYKNHKNIYLINISNKGSRYEYIEQPYDDNDDMWTLFGLNEKENIKIFYGHEENIPLFENYDFENVVKYMITDIMTQDFEILDESNLKNDFGLFESNRFEKRLEREVLYILSIPYRYKAIENTSISLITQPHKFGIGKYSYSEYIIGISLNVGIYSYSTIDFNKYKVQLKLLDELLEEDMDIEIINKKKFEESHPNKKWNLEYRIKINDTKKIDTKKIKKKNINNLIDNIINYSTDSEVLDVLIQNFDLNNVQDIFNTTSRTNYFITKFLYEKYDLKIDEQTIINSISSSSSYRNSDYLIDYLIKNSKLDSIELRSVMTTVFTDKRKVYSTPSESIFFIFIENGVELKDYQLENIVENMFKKRNYWGYKKLSDKFIDYIIDNDFTLMKYFIDNMVPDQKEKYKMYVALIGDFDIFESKINENIESISNNIRKLEEIFKEYKLDINVRFSDEHPFIKERYILEYKDKIYSLIYKEYGNYKLYINNKEVFNSINIEDCGKALSNYIVTKDFDIFESLENRYNKTRNIEKKINKLLGKKYTYKIETIDRHYLDDYYDELEEYSKNIGYDINTAESIFFFNKEKEFRYTIINLDMSKKKTRTNRFSSLPWIDKFLVVEFLKEGELNIIEEFDDIEDAIKYILATEMTKDFDIFESVYNDENIEIIKGILEENNFNFCDVYFSRIQYIGDLEFDDYKKQYSIYRQEKLIYIINKYDNYTTLFKFGRKNEIYYNNNDFMKVVEFMIVDMMTDDFNMFEGLIPMFPGSNYLFNHKKVKQLNDGGNEEKSNYIPTDSEIECLVRDVYDIFRKHCGYVRNWQFIKSIFMKQHHIEGLGQAYHKNGKIYLSLAIEFDGVDKLKDIREEIEKKYDCIMKFDNHTGKDGAYYRVSFSISNLKEEMIKIICDFDIFNDD